MAAALFVEANGLSFGTSEEEVVVQTRGLAAGEIGAEDHDAWLEVSCVTLG